MKTATVRFKIVSLLTLFFFLQACTVHSLKTIPKEEFKVIQSDKIVILHQRDQTFLLYNPILSEGELSGIIKPHIPDDNLNISKYDEIHIYLNTFYPEFSINDEKASIKIEDIDKIEIFDFNTKKAALNLSAGFGVLILIASGILVWAMQTAKTEDYKK